MARGFIPAGPRSSPKTWHHGFYRHTESEEVATATQPSGDFLWRGDSSPLGCKAAPKPATTVSTGTPHVSKLRLLRSRAGINPLITKRLFTSRDIVCVRKELLWLADLSVMQGFPVARGLIPVGLQSSPKTCQHGFYRHSACEEIAPAAQSSGDKSPRHNEAVHIPGCCLCEERIAVASRFISHAGFPVARGFIPVGLQSSPKTCQHGFYRHTACGEVATAAQPSGDKSPRHKNAAPIPMMCLCERWTPCG